MQKKPLESIKVIDFSTFLAVPQCGRMLASLGADVIKIETIEDEFFRIEAPIFKVGIPYTNDENPIYLNANAGKRFISMNIKTQRGKEIFLKLIKSADVFITNVRMPALERLHVTYDDLHKVNPSLVYGYLNGYGTKGEELTKPGFDSQAYLARGGYLLDLSEPGSEPNEQVLGMGDGAAGVALAAGVLSALIGAKRNGIGRFVSTSLLNTAIWNATMHLVLVQYGLEFPRSRTNPPTALANVYRCKDEEWLSLMNSSSIMDDWASLCKALNMEDLIDNERYNSIEKQRANRQEIVELLDKKFAEKTYVEWVGILANSNLTYERVAHLLEVIDDPQVVDNRFFLKRTYKSGKQVSFAVPPFKIDGLEEEDLERTIHRGEHTKEILGELGYSPEEIVRLEEEKVIYSLKEAKS